MSMRSRFLTLIPALIPSALLAQEGHHEEAIEMVEAMDRRAVQMGAGAQTVIEHEALL